MNNLHSKWFTNKKFVIMSILIAFAVSVFSAFSFNVKSNKTQTVSAAQSTQEIQTETKESSFSVSVGESSGLNVVPLANQSFDAENGTWEVSSTQLTGGTTISIDWATSEIKAGGTKIATFSPSAGYELISITVTGTGSFGEESVPRDFPFSKTTEQICPTYTPGNTKIIFTAHCMPIEYTLSMYYAEDYKSTSYSEDKKQEQTFTIESDGLAIDKLTGVDLGTDDKAFLGWMLKDRSYSVEGSTVTAGGVNFTFEGTVEENDVKYFKITAIEEGSIGSFGSLNNGDPDIRAMWSNVYDITIDNTAANWKGDEKNTNHLLSGVLTGTNTSVTTQDADTAIIKAHNSEEKNLGFQCNNHAFLNSEDLKTVNDKWETGPDKSEQSYVVYNYGYKITGWKVYYEITGRSNKYYFSYGNNNGTTPYAWSITAGAPQQIYLSDLNNETTPANTQTLAAELDRLTLLYPSLLSSFTIKMVPVWSEVTIDVVKKNGDGEIVATLADNLTYNAESTYTLDFTDKDLTIPSGQSVFYVVTTKNENVIAKQGKWNYYQIDNSDFDESSNEQEGTYILPVDEFCLDDIFKVSLAGARSTTLGNTDYTVATTTYANDRYSAESFWPEETFIQGNWTYIEDYTTELKSYAENTYLKDSTHASCTMLKKVYDTGAKLENNPYYIYLANNHQIGKLPTFTVDYYTLISWDTNKATDHTNNFVYKTALYVKDDHQDDYDETIINSENLKTLATDAEFTGNWHYEDMLDGGSYGMTLNTHYFRKNYVLEINNVLNTDGKEYRVGYSIIVIDDKVDNSYDGIYIAIFNTDDTKVYNATALVDCTDAKLVTDFRLYAGCDITIIAMDQSKDHSEDNFIGYRYLSITATHTPKNNQETVKSPIFDQVTYSDYDANALDADIEDLNYRTGDIITINVAFEPIKYDLDIVLSQYKHGWINANNQTNNTAVIHITNATVGYETVIKYFAYAGYEFDTEAIKFTPRGGSYAKLATYNNTNLNLTNNVTGSTSLTQEYNFVMNGAWLRKYFYDKVCTDYSVQDQTGADGGAGLMGTISIETTKIQFKIGYELLDSTNGGILNDSTIMSSIDKQVIGNVINSVIGSMPNLSSDLGFNCIKYNEVNYAILSSVLYYRANVEGYSADKTMYPFLLDLSTLKDQLVLSEDANNANNLNKIIATSQFGYNGKIVPADARTLSVLIEVRELLEITLTLKDAGIFKSDSSISATIVNGDNNTKNVSGNENSVTIYTYNPVGVLDKNNKQITFVNKITTEYDNNRFKAVEYYTNEDLTTKFEGNANSFNVNADTELFIKYIPKTIDAEIKYYLDGVETALSQLDDYISDNSIGGLTGFSPYNREHKNYNSAVHKTVLNARYTIADGVYYEIEFIVNGNPAATEDVNTSGKTYALGYKVQDSDFDNFGKINVEVRLERYDSSIVKVRYALDNGALLEGENYGDFTILVQNTPVAHNAKDIGEGKDVEVEIVKEQTLVIDLENLAKGFEYTGIVVHNSNAKENVYKFEDGKITITESYIPGTEADLQEAGTYKIIVKKSEVKVKLDYSNSSLTTDKEKIAGYQLKAGGNVTNAVNSNVSNTLGGLILGDKITLIEDPKDIINTERLKAFYYEDQAGNKTWLTSDKTEDGQPLDNVTITSEMLNAFDSNEITIKFTVVKRYNAVINIDKTSLSYIDSRSYTHNGQPYSSGTYLDLGSVVNIKVETINPGKYDIVVNEESAVDSLDYEVTLNSDKTITIKVTPKTYGLTMKNMMYSSLPCLENVCPEVVAQTTTPNYSSYNKTETRAIDLRNSSAQLQSIVISGNDKSFDISIVYNGSQLTATWNDAEAHSTTNLTEIETVLGYKLTIETNGDYVRLIVSYTVLNDISITTTYVAFKEISQM